MAQLLITTIFFDAEKSYLYAILRTISSFFPYEKIFSYQKLCHSIFATPPHDYPSLSFRTYFRTCSFVWQEYRGTTEIKHLMMLWTIWLSAVLYFKDRNTICCCKISFSAEMHFRKLDVIKTFFIFLLIKMASYSQLIHGN